MKMEMPLSALFLFVILPAIMASAPSGTKDPMPEAFAADQAVIQSIAAFRKIARNKGQDQSKQEEKQPERLFQRDETIIVPVCWHMPRYRRYKMHGRMNQHAIQANIDHWNRAWTQYSCCDTSLDWCNGECSRGEANIHFQIARKGRDRGTIDGLADRPGERRACVTRRWPGLRNWFRFRLNGTADDPLEPIKKSEHWGGPEVLNVYVLNGLSRVAGYDAYSTLPQDYRDNPQLDGVVGDKSVFLQSAKPSRGNSGDSMVHEIGHWLGLLNTFFGGCFGEGIPDTPAQFIPHYGCDPEVFQTLDTCLDDDILDPVHNFMDLSDDECRYEFTPDQVESVYLHWDFYRGQTISLRNETLNNGVPFVTSIPTDSFQVFQLTSIANVFFTIRTEADNGDVDMYVNFSGDTISFECSSTAFSDPETGIDIDQCVVGRHTGTVYIFLYGYLGVRDLTVTCTLST